MGVCGDRGGRDRRPSAARAAARAVAPPAGSAQSRRRPSRSPSLRSQPPRAAARRRAGAAPTPARAHARPPEPEPEPAPGRPARAGRITTGRSRTTAARSARTASGASRTAAASAGSSCSPATSRTRARRPTAAAVEHLTSVSLDSPERVMHTGGSAWATRAACHPRRVPASRTAGHGPAAARTAHSVWCFAARSSASSLPSWPRRRRGPVRSWSSRAAVREAPADREARAGRGRPPSGPAADRRRARDGRRLGAPPARRLRSDGHGINVRCAADSTCTLPAAVYAPGGQVVSPGRRSQRDGRDAARRHGSREGLARDLPPRHALVTAVTEG